MDYPPRYRVVDNPPYPSVLTPPPRALLPVRRSRGLGGIGTALPNWGYALAALAGAGLGGALIGYVAADDKPGAQKGAAFAAGLAGVSDGVATWQGDRLLGTVLIVGGLGGMWWSVKGKLRR